MSITDSTLTLEQEPLTAAQRTGFRWFMRQLMKRRSAQVGGIIVVILLFCAIFGKFIVPYDPFEIATEIRLTPPNSEHWFGTDELGRDLFSRVVYGSRYTVMIGLITVAIASTGGVTLGLIASYFGGKVDTVIMRMMDVLLSFPFILLQLAIVSVLGPSLVNAMVAVGIAGIAGYARLIRSKVLSVREEEYVEAMRALGASNARIMFRTILPNVTSTIVVYMTLSMPLAVLSTASLSFLGLGTQPPLPEWGAMLTNSRSFIATAFWVVAAPGLAIFITIFGLNLFGNAVRDVLDPREK
jgi:peptide/nickel transport system permease protein